MAQDENSVLGLTTPTVWSSDRAVGYEVVQESIGLVIAGYSAKVSAEQRKEHPDQALLESMRAEITAWSKRRRELRSADMSQVRRTQDEANALIAGFWD